MGENLLNKLSWVELSKINLNDPFFDSLKTDYPGFDEWFKRKSRVGKKALTLVENDHVYAFLFLQEQCEEISLTNITLPQKKRLKISTFKIDDSIGRVRLGEGLIGISLWYWQRVDAEEIFVTSFPKQEKLIGIFEKFGFQKVGQKENGELILLRSKKNIVFSNPYMSFPFIAGSTKHAGIVPINDYFHDQLFPYSESYSKDVEVAEVTAGNGITKVYIGNPATATHYRDGDVVGIYRIHTGSGQKTFISAITSLCTITKVTIIKQDGIPKYSLTEYLDFAGNKTVFDKATLTNLYRKENVVMIEMVYNMFFGKGHNVTHRKLDDNGLFPTYPYNIDYSIQDIKTILKLGDQNVENIIID